MSKNNLVDIKKSISNSFNYLSLNDKVSEREEYARLATDYKIISEKLNTNQFNTNEAKIEIIQNNSKIPVSDKTRRIGAIITH